MQSQTRKRPAPGTSPLPLQQQQQQQQQQGPGTYPFDPSASAHYTNDGSISIPNSNYDPALYGNNINGMEAQNFPLNIASSNQLVRRNGNQSLATRPSGSQEQWNFGGSSNVQDQAQDVTKEDDEDLEQRAAAAKRDAQSKRKQIPPFVLKLWSFLNESRNTDLIRWTDGGTAFTVLDEDEFARTLIPELFKHNNYASFVRQLNMYGFHKKVGLNANSMKAAEKKIKDPNVYWHEYFREGREDLLWLIQKPQSKSAAAKRKRSDQRGGQGDSDDDGRGSPDIVEGQPVGRVGGGSSDMITLPRTEVSELRQEIQRLQRQQSVISKMIVQLKDQNEQFYRQATEFQSLHDRHENSINAILTFLATFYSKSLEAGVDLAGMFGNNTTQQGSVVDVDDGEYGYPNNTNDQQLQRYKRPQLFLEGSSPAKPGYQSLRNNARATSAQSTASPGIEQQQRRNASLGAQSGSSQARKASVSPALKDDADTPNSTNQYPESDDMMSLINATNANTPNANGPNFDFPSALNHAQNANGSAPLTPQQREDMLNLIASQANGQQGGNNALANPNPPPMPSLDQFNRNQKQLEMLTRMQREQDSKVQDLAGRLQPLSPTGGIPGLHEGANYGDNMAPPSSDFDIDAFINSDDNYFNNFNNNNDIGGQATFDPNVAGNTGMGTTGIDYNFGDTGLDFDFSTMGNTNNNIGSTTTTTGATGTDDIFGDVGGLVGDNENDLDGGGRVVESLSSEGTSPANTTSNAFVSGNEDGGVGQQQQQQHLGGDEETPTKRRRMGP